MEERKKKNGWLYYAAILIFFATGMWAVGLVMLLGKIFSSGSKKKNVNAQSAPPPLSGALAEISKNTQNTQSTQNTRKQPVNSIPFYTENSAKKGNPISNPKKKTKRIKKPSKLKTLGANLLKILGILLIICGLIVAGASLNDALYYDFREVRMWLMELMQGAGFTVSGFMLLFKGIFVDRNLKRFANYLSVMGDREAIALEELSRTMGYSKKRVQKDLQKMIDKGYLGESAYLNMELGYLFRSSQADTNWKQKRAEQEAEQQNQEQAREAREAELPTEDNFVVILENIHHANVVIADPVLSTKIERLEEVVRKIFKAVEDDPKKGKKIDRFLDYYLPTTQKLLDSYAQFESAGVEGENLRQAKTRIESTMDSIVKGFEHQLDELYKDDVMDVDSDIRVMEHMLRRDTASASDDFGLDDTF